MQIQPILGYFWAILGFYQPSGPPLLDLGPPFLHILDPPLSVVYFLSFYTINPPLRGFPSSASKISVELNKSINSVCTHLNADSYYNTLRFQQSPSVIAKISCVHSAKASYTQHDCIFVWFLIAKSYKLTVLTFINCQFLTFISKIRLASPIKLCIILICSIWTSKYPKKKKE